MKPLIIWVSQCACLVLVWVGAASAQTLSLTEAEDRLSGYNLTLLAERFYTEAAYFEARQSGKWGNPELEIAELPFKNQPDGSGRHIAASLSKEFETAGKRRLRTAQYRAWYEQQRWQKEDIRRYLLRELRTLFAIAQINQHRAELVGREYESFVRLARASDEAWADGDISRFENNRIQAMLVEAEKTLADIKLEQSQVRYDIKVLLSWDGDLPELVFPQTAPFLSKPVMKASIDTRPDILALRAGLEAGKKELAYERAKRIPDITGGVVFDRYSSSYDNLWGISFGLKVPVFDRNRHGIAASKARRNALEQQLHQSLLEENQRVAATWHRYEMLSALYDKYDSNILDTFSGMVEMTLDAYRSGDIDLTTLSDALRSYRETTATMLDLKEDLAQTYYKLYYLMPDSEENP